MALAFVPIYIRFIGVEGYGLVGIFVTIQMLFTLLDFGLSTTVNREVARLSSGRGTIADIRDLVRTFEWVYWTMAGIVALVLVGLSGPLVTYWLNPRELEINTVRNAILIMAVIMALQWPLNCYSGGLLGLQRHVVFNIIHAGVGTARALGAVLVLWRLSPTIEAFFLWQAFVSGLHTLLARAVLWRSLGGNPGASFRRACLTRVWRFSAGLTAISVVTVVLTQSDKVVLSRLLTLEHFGYYTLAGVVAGSLHILIGPIFTAVFPRFSQLVGSGDSRHLREQYHGACQLISVAVLPPMIVLALFARDVLFVWTGDTVIVEQTHGLLSLLVVGTGLNGLMNVPYALQLAHGWTRLAFWINLVATLLLVPLLVWLVGLYGAVAAAGVWVGLNAAYVVVGLLLMHRRLLPGELKRWYLEDVVPPLCAVLAVAGAARLMMPVSANRVELAGWIAIVSVVALAAAALAAPLVRFGLRRRVLLLGFPGVAR